MKEGVLQLKVLLLKVVLQIRIVLNNLIEIKVPSNKGNQKDVYF